MLKFLAIFSIYFFSATAWAESEVASSETLQNGQFYSHMDGYTCKLENGDRIYSYKDSIYFNDDEICKTGDLCSQKVECKNVSEIKDLYVFSDELQVVAFGTTFVYGKDLSEINGLPNKEDERTMASIVPPQDAQASSQLTLIYILWAIGLSIIFYMKAPEKLK